MRSPTFVGLVVLLAVVLAAPPASATFPGTNGKIAFFIFNVQPPQIAVIGADGTGRTTLTHTAHRANYDPAWSADGTKIAFDTSLNGSPPTLRMMNADGSSSTLVVAMSSTYVDIEHPSWSPDGTKIAFCALNQHIHGKIFTVTTDGSATLVKLSPKGRRLPTRLVTRRDDDRLRFVPGPGPSGDLDDGRGWEQSREDR